MNPNAYAPLSTAQKERLTPLRTVIAATVSNFAAATVLALLLTLRIAEERWLFPSLNLMFGVPTALVLGGIYVGLRGWLMKQSKLLAALLFGLLGYTVTFFTGLLWIPPNAPQFVLSWAVTAIPGGLVPLSGWLLFTGYVRGGFWKKLAVWLAVAGVVAGMAGIVYANTMPILTQLNQS